MFERRVTVRLGEYAFLPECEKAPADNRRLSVKYKYKTGCKIRRR